jgi:hypothetical protein
MHTIVRSALAALLIGGTLSACAKKPDGIAEFLDKNAKFFNCRTEVLVGITGGGHTLAIRGRKFPFLLSSDALPANGDRWRLGDTIQMCEFQAVGAPTWRFIDTRSWDRIYVSELDGSM